MHTAHEKSELSPAIEKLDLSIRRAKRRQYASSGGGFVKLKILSGETPVQQENKCRRPKKGWVRWAAEILFKQFQRN